MTPEELREWYINDIESKQIVIDDLQAQLSSKEQECEKLKDHFENVKEKMVVSSNKLATRVADQLDELASLRVENKNINDYCQGLTEDRDKLRKRCEDLEAALKENLPEDCVTGETEVKFCHIRQGDGWKCKHCAIFNF